MQPELSDKPRFGMRDITRRDVLAGSALGGMAAVLSSPALAASGWDRAAAMDAVIDDAVNSGQIVGASDIAAKNGAIVYRGCAGFADREAQRPMAETRSSGSLR